MIVKIEIDTQDIANCNGLIEITKAVKEQVLAIMDKAKEEQSDD